MSQRTCPTALYRLAKTVKCHRPNAGNTMELCQEVSVSKLAVVSKDWSLMIGFIALGLTGLMVAPDISSISKATWFS